MIFSRELLFYSAKNYSSIYMLLVENMKARILRKSSYGLKLGTIAPIDLHAIRQAIVT